MNHDWDSLKQGEMFDSNFLSKDRLYERYLERKELLGDRLGINKETYELIKKQYKELL